MTIEITYSAGQPNVELPVPCTLVLYKDGSYEIRPHYTVDSRVYMPPETIVEIVNGGDKP